jgi:hypothetical protein
VGVLLKLFDLFFSVLSGGTDGMLPESLGFFLLSLFDFFILALIPGISGDGAMFFVFFLILPLF